MGSEGDGFLYWMLLERRKIYLFREIATIETDHLFLPTFIASNSNHLTQSLRSLVEIPFRALPFPRSPGRRCDAPDLRLAPYAMDS